TGHCPTGVATSNHWLNRGLNIDRSALRCANYLIEMRQQLATLSHACGLAHPGEFTDKDIEIINAQQNSANRTE
ncbi:MAG: glutamate synthase-related protein, partial [Acidimicrobiia bacterium]